MSRYRHALVAGKFYPPHLGHHRLIEQASNAAQRVTVVVMASKGESIPLAQRVDWLRAVYALSAAGKPGRSTVEVVGIACDVPIDLENRSIWEAHVALMQAAVRQAWFAGGPNAGAQESESFEEAEAVEPIDVVFSNQQHGPTLAKMLGAALMATDTKYVAVPVSSAQIRADLVGNWSWLHPIVRGGLAVRVVAIGSESTGTTTLSKALAEHYRLRGGAWSTGGWIPEWGREYTYIKLDRARAVADPSQPAPDMDDLVWTAADFTDIAVEQTRMEDEAAIAGSPVLCCDTDAFATLVWEYRYMGPHSHGALAAATTDLPGNRIYLVTDHLDVAFEHDEIRDGEHIRGQMTGWFIDGLTRAGHSWVLLRGDRQTRLDLAIRIVDAQLAARMRFSEPLV